MLISISSIFLSAFLGGIIAYFLGSLNPNTFRFLLLFIGSYLLSLTLLHLLPELFISDPHTSYVGIGLLVGFFLQLLLGLFSKGIEHGHIYEKNHNKHGYITSANVLLISLSIHAFFDGAVLSNVASHADIIASHTRVHNHLLIGIVLHKASEAFAFVNILRTIVQPVHKIIGYLLAFSVASPLGVWISWYSSNAWANTTLMRLLTALAVGNLLQIATTIFFEASPHHQLNIKSGLSILAGIGLVVILEYFI